MSAVAAAARPAPAGAAPAVADRTERQRLVAFFALAAFASLVYGELVLHPPALRLLAVAAVVTAACAALGLRRRDGRPLLAPAPRALVLAAALGLCLLVLGVPARLLLPWHWGRFERGVSHGVAGLGAWLWPYRGGAWWARLAVLLVVPVTLLAAGALNFWPGAGRLRRAAALALLVGLFLAGAANAPQAEAGLRGLVLLALIAAWLAPPLASAGGAWRASRWLAVPALLALALRPAVSSPSAWIDFRDGPGAGSGVTSFQWDQSYGPMSWPRSEDTVLTVQSPNPGLLRVTSLDRFNGVRFLRSSAVPRTAALEENATAHLSRRWLSRETITLAGFRFRLLAGGEGLTLGLHWLGLGARLVGREPDGTIAASSSLETGAYSVLTYRPRPSAAEMLHVPRSYPRAYRPYVAFELPGPSDSGLDQPRFAAEAAGTPPASRLIEPSVPGRAIWQEPIAAARVERSPYAPMLRLARGLAAGAPSGFAVAERLERFLLANYGYDEHVRRARYPLEAFLFEQRRGYCQQFSGAMALMLRMDGIPARVASGFRPAVFDPVSGTWRIRALDAHAWVEAFFSGVGWVSFDPTPVASAHISGAAASSQNKSEISGAAADPATRSAAGAATALRATASGGRDDGTLAAVAAAGLAAAAALALGGLWLRGRRRLRRTLRGDPTAAVEELRRVLAGRGDEPPGTLAQLERLLREDGARDAGDYVRALRHRRYAPAPAAEPPSTRGRAAFRRALMRDASRRARFALLARMPPGAMRGSRG